MHILKPSYLSFKVHKVTRKHKKKHIISLILFLILNIFNIKAVVL